MSNTASKLNLTNERSKARRLSCDKIIQTSLLTLFAAILVIPASGCASGFRIPRLGFGDALLEKYRDNVWARRAFNLRFANCDIPYPQHFQNGFVAGYSETCNGGDGYVPPLPPDEYRGYEFQSADGAQCVKAWFDGYPAGVAAARKDRAGDFHDIYTSKMINSALAQDNAKHLVPSPPYRAAKLSPVTSPNPILNPSSITASDLTPAPRINKSGPSAMKRASSRFAIDPAVAVNGPLVPNNSVGNVASKGATLPPIVSGAVSPPIIAGKINSVRPNVTKRVGPVVNQTPLPLSVGKPSWESNSPAIRR